METTTKAGQIDIYLSSIDPGDTVILPGDPTPRLVVRTWFVMNNARGRRPRARRASAAGPGLV